MAQIQFEDILPWGTTGGDTGLSSRLKLKRNFDKIKLLFDQWPDLSGEATAWGRTFWQDGVPVTIPTTDDLTLTGGARLLLGDGVLSWDDVLGVGLWSRGLAALGSVSALGYSAAGGGGDVALGPLLTLLNDEPVPATDGYLHWTGSAFEWVEPGGGGDMPSTVAWNNITGKPATFTPSEHDHDGRYYIDGGTIYLGGNSITPLTQHQSLAGYATEAYVQQACDSVVGHVASNFVAKVSGKGLSANDFTNELLAKLNGIEEGANKYVHPSYSAAEITASAGKVLSAITVNGLGHVTSVASKTLATADIPALAASKITSGTFDAARIPGLPASKITSGVLDVARIPSLTKSKISDFPTTWAWSAITGTPTTLADYGITDAATAAQMTAATGRLTALESLFDANGVAKSALRLSGTATYTAWGQAWWQDGVPKGSFDGDLARVGNIYFGSAHKERIFLDTDGINVYSPDTNYSLYVYGGGAYVDGSIDVFENVNAEGNVVAQGAVSALGYSADGGGAAGATYLRELLDVNIGGTPSAGQVLTFRNGYWVAETMQVPTPDLSAYATKTWVEQNWQIKDMIESNPPPPPADGRTYKEACNLSLSGGTLMCTHIRVKDTFLKADITDFAHTHMSSDILDLDLSGYALTTDVSQLRSDVGSVVTGIDVDGDTICCTYNNVDPNQAAAQIPVTVPFATRASELRRNYISSGTLDANTMTIGGTKYAIAANYYSTAAWVNAPSGMSYGAVMELAAGSGVGVLSGQLAWDVTHNSTTPTHRLWWRARNSSGWGDDWKEIAFVRDLQSALAGYLPLKAGSDKPLTGDLYFASYGRGVYLMDGAGDIYPGIRDNGTNLWIGAEQTSARHHHGNTIISSGHDGTAGNPTIFVCVPNAANNRGTSYGVLHAGNFRAGTEYTSWTDFSEFAANVQTNYATKAQLAGYLPLLGGTLTGSLNIVNGSGLYIKDTGGTNRMAVLMNSQNQFFVGFGMRQAGYEGYFDSGILHFRTTSGEVTMLANGNVGIGTTTPNDYKLDVAGAIRTSGSGGYGIVLDNDQAVTLRDSTGAHMRSMFLNSVNRLAIGYGTTKTGGYDTQLCGHEIILSTGGGSGTDPIEAARFTADSKLKIGNGYIEWDYTNNMLKFSGGNGIYALGAVSALGIAGDLDGQVTRAMTFTEAVTMRGTLSLAGTINTDVTIGQYTQNNLTQSRKLCFGDANHYIQKDTSGQVHVKGDAYFENDLTVSGSVSFEDALDVLSDVFVGDSLYLSGDRTHRLYVENGHLYFNGQLVK